MPSDENILSLVHKLSSRIGRAFHDEIVAHHGLGLGEWRVLLSLAGEPGLSAADITSRWAMDKMAITRAVARLVAAGRVERRPSTVDRRKYSLYLTAAGSAKYQAVLPDARQRYRQIVAGLSADERRVAHDLLSRLIDQASLLADKPGRR